jgi:DNA-binding MarR family transcriptional regulator
MKRDIVPLNVTDLLGFKVLRLSNTLGGAAERQYARDLNISVTEWRCLSIIASRGPIVAADIVAAIRCDKAWVSRTLARLAERKLVRITPDPEDGRRQLVQATAAGMKLSDRTLQAACARHQRVMAALTPSEREAFAKILDALQAEADTVLAEQIAIDEGKA